jgi:hypothetical protein
MDLAPSSRTVALLRPANAGVVRLHELIEDEHADPMELFNAEKDDDAIDSIRETIETTAKQCSLLLHVHEYTLSEGADTPSSEAARALVTTSNVITVIDPSDTQLSFVIECMRQNPLISSLFPYRDRHFLDEKFEILQVQSEVLLGPNGKKQPRIFTVKYDPAHAEKMIPSIKRALLYPLEAI